MPSELDARHRKDKVVAHLICSKLAQFRDLSGMHTDSAKEMHVPSELKPQVFVVSLLSKFYLLCVRSEVSSVVEGFMSSGTQCCVVG